MKMLLAIASLSVLTAAGTASAKDYQVTGTVVEVSDSKIIVDKKGEKFEIAKSAGVKTTGEVTVGGKVTVYYSMTATEIESKGAAKEPKKKK
ncbi:MAG: hypothetical protein H7256_11385 [Bdellovibrio sp.]|nr:hypothetical protein [Bdellovibrio sp.]